MSPRTFPAGYKRHNGARGRAKDRDLGIEDKQEPVEKDQGRVADFLQRDLGRGGGDRLGERRKYAIEHQLGDAACDPLLIEPAFVDCPLMKRLRIGWRRQERLAAEKQG